MKNIFLKSFALAILFFTAVLTVSCDKDDDRIDFYKSQNRSEELKGWWKRISNEEHPDYMVFEEFTYKNVTYLENQGYYNPSEGDYWYNNNSHIFSLSVSNFKSNGVENQIPYKMNITKDTLQLYNEATGYYVKATQP